MSENLHNIDDLFKKAIDEHVDTPSQNVWDAIDKNLDKKKVVSISRKYNKLKWAAAILLLFSTGMAMYVWQTRMKNKELVKQNNINKASKSIKENNNLDEKNSTSDSNEKIITPEKKIESQNEKQINSTQSQTVTNSDTQINSSQTQPVTNIDKQPDQSQAKAIANTDKQKTQQANSVQQNIANPQREKDKLLNSSQQNITREKVEKEQMTNKNEKKLEHFDNSKQQKNSEVITQGEVKTKAPENTISTPEKYIVDAPIIFTQRPHMNGLQEIQSSNTFSFQPPIIATDKTVALENNKRTSSKKIASRSSNISPFSATLFFSPEFVSSDVEDDHPRFREDDRNEIKNHEKIRSSTSYGVLLDYTVGSNWRLQSGASVSTRVTDINTKTIYARPDNYGNVNYRLSCSAGSVYVPLKSGAIPTQGDSTKILSAKNTLQYVSIPLVVKYTIGKGKFNLVPGVGISANILSEGKIETVIATTGGNESSSTSKIDGLKSNYFSGQISLGGEYLISKKVALNFTPTARLALSSINKDAAVKTKFNSLGLSAGITLKF